MKRAELLAGVLILVFVFSGLVSAKPQADVDEWTAIDLFVRYQIDVASKTGTLEDSHFVDKVTELVLLKFGKELDAEISKYAKDLTLEQREHLKYLLVSDYVSHLYQKSFYPKNAKVLVVKPIKVASVKAGSRVYDYYYAPMSSSIPYPIHWWVQVKVDIDGGLGIDGKNDLYNIVVVYSSTRVEYELHFYDEDHPYPDVDKRYDEYRCDHYPDRDSTYGCEDIESIVVENGVIQFPSTWSYVYECNGNYCHWRQQTYSEVVPTHSSGERSYSSSVAIYVSNTWNHLMDIVDSNPSMEKVWWYTSWS